MDKQELDQLIDKSILGKLSQDESSKLDAYIMEHPDTRLEIKMRTDVIKGLEYNADQEFKSILNKIHTDEIPRSTNHFFNKKVWIIGFSLCACLGILILFNYINTETNSSSIQNSELYASYFKPYVPSLETRSNEDLQEEKYQSFINSYRDKDYRKSLEIIKPVLEDADNNTLLLASICAMESDSFQESIGYLDQILESNDYYFIDHAKWYKALVLIKTDDVQQAKKLLEELAGNSNADHHNESVALIEEI